MRRLVSAVKHLCIRGKENADYLLFFASETTD